MIVEIRIYKRFDTDLVALSDAGYSVAALMKEALVNYAHGTPVYFLLDEIHDYNPVDKNSVHIRIKIPDKDVRTCYMLRNIKKTYRNTFCKCLLRNALIQQNLNALFADKNLYQLQSVNLQSRPVSYMANVKPCSQYKKNQVKKEVTVPESQPVNPFGFVPTEIIQPTPIITPQLQVPETVISTPVAQQPVITPQVPKQVSVPETKPAETKVESVNRSQSAENNEQTTEDLMNLFDNL